MKKNEKNEKNERNNKKGKKEKEEKEGKTKKTKHKTFVIDIDDLSIIINDLYNKVEKHFYDD